MDKTFPTLDVLLNKENLTHLNEESKHDCFLVERYRCNFENWNLEEIMGAAVQQEQRVLHDLHASRLADTCKV